MWDIWSTLSSTPLGIWLSNLQLEGIWYILKRETNHSNSCNLACFFLYGFAPQGVDFDKCQMPQINRGIKSSTSMLKVIFVCYILEALPYFFFFSFKWRKVKETCPLRMTHTSWCTETRMTKTSLFLPLWSGTAHIAVWITRKIHWAMQLFSYLQCIIFSTLNIHQHSGMSIFPTAVYSWWYRSPFQHASHS